MDINYQKIILPTRPQPDTILGIFLLKKFGKEKYPGIEKAGVEIWQELPKNETAGSLEKKGILVLDLGGGKFDHHQTGKTLSQLVAEDLEISNNPTMKKLLLYGERDDKYGLGTISSDPIDKAFGLSGLIASLNRVFPKNPEKVIETILPLIEAHYLEERKKVEELPQEFEEKLKESKAEVFEVKQGEKKLKVIVLESDNLSMAGWLRSSDGEKADVVCQKVSSGYVNILTKPLKKVDLRWLSAYIRNEEAKLRGRRLRYLTPDLMQPGKIPEIPEWYYDRATNSVLNGGPNPKGILPTAIPFQSLKEILKEALSQETPTRKVPLKSGAGQYFLEIRLPIEIAKEIKKMLIGLPAGIKVHLSENYHITLIYLGSLGEELSKTIRVIKNVLRNFKPFEIIIDGKNFKSGRVPGYPTKAFYFEIKDYNPPATLPAKGGAPGEGGKILREIRNNLEKEVSSFQKEEFFPHLTVATALPRIEEKVIREAEMKVKDGKKIKFLVEKIRLTEILRKPSGEAIYKVKGNFYL